MTARPPLPGVITPGALSRRAKALYRTGPLALRLLQCYRPYLCPFDRLIPLVSSGASLLDVGCGAGLFLALLDSYGLVAYGLGLDTSAAALGLARQMAKERGLLEFRQLDVTEPWPEGRFSVVALIDVLHHVPRAHRRLVFERGAERVAPGGVLLYKDVAPRPRWKAAANSLHDLVVARQLVSYTELTEVDGWARAAGLSLRYAESPHRLWYPHEIRLYAR